MVVPTYWSEEEPADCPQQYCAVACSVYTAHSVAVAGHVMFRAGPLAPTSGFEPPFNFITPNSYNLACGVGPAWLPALYYHGQDQGMEVGNSCNVKTLPHRIV